MLVHKDLEKALANIDAVVFAVRHKEYLALEPGNIVRAIGKPVAVIDCFGLLDDGKIKQYIESGCEVKGMGRGHIRRLKETIRRKGPQ